MLLSVHVATFSSVPTLTGCSLGQDQTPSLETLSCSDVIFGLGQNLLQQGQLARSC